MSKQISYNTIGSMVTLFFQWLIMMLIPKITDFSDAGIFAVALSICSIMNIVATLSLNTYQVADQYQKYSENDYFQCRALTIILSFVLCVLTIVFMGYSTEQGLVIIGYMLYRNFLHLAYLHTATLQIEEHLDYVGKCTILEGIVSFISFIGVYLVTNNLVISTIVMAILGGGIFLLSIAIGYRKYLGRNYPMRIERTENLKKLIILGVPMMLSVIAPIIITALPKLTLQQYWGDELAGIFSTLTAPTIIIPTLVTGIFAPFIVRFSNYAKKGDMRTIRVKYMKLIGLTLGFGVISLFISILCAGFFFELFYGADIVPYVHYFNVLVVGIAVYSIGMCGITVLITKEQGREAAISTIAALLISLVIFMTTIPKYGIESATYGLLASYTIFAVFVSICVLCIKPRNMTE